MKAAKAPCAACPWRIDASAAAIPNFSIELAEGLARTCPDARGVGPELGASIFACHESRQGVEFACAGWLATQGDAHPMVRLAIMQGRLSPDRLRPGSDWPALHHTFHEMIAKLRCSASMPASNAIVVQLAGDIEHSVSVGPERDVLRGLAVHPTIRLDPTAGVVRTAQDGSWSLTHIATGSPLMQAFWCASEARAAMGAVASLGDWLGATGEALTGLRLAALDVLLAFDSVESRNARVDLAAMAGTKAGVIWKLNREEVLVLYATPKSEAVAEDAARIAARLPNAMKNRHGLKLGRKVVWTLKRLHGHGLVLKRQANPLRWSR